MKKILSFLFSRMFIIGFAIFVQAVILFSLIWKLSSYFVYVYGAFTFLSLVIAIWLISSDDNPSAKLPWIFIVCILPVFGGIAYLMFGVDRFTAKYKNEMGAVGKKTASSQPDNAAVFDALEKEDIDIANQCRYMKTYSGISPYQNTSTKYLSPGEVKLDAMLEELKKAEKFIFMEYFIIEEGKMWNAILDILAQKAKDGLDVRVMFDDVGCVNTLPYKYDEKLKAMGIRCAVFNSFEPTLSTKFNNRDHRKITVIDGKVAFNGGINLADEYINAFEKHGHWKDAAVMLKGDAVWGFTAMFMENWSLTTHEDENFLNFCANDNNKQGEHGVVQPFMDTPFNGELVSETVYMNIINCAKQYLYINSPYLIVDNELITALKMASKRGVDVRIVTPHVADKAFVHLITRAYYPMLIDAGVKIFEYTPGFMHSKTFLCDDRIGVVGTINLDYRSLYHHLECGTWMYRTQCLSAMKQDYLDTLAVCTPITMQWCESVGIATRLLRSVLRIFAPLM